MQYIYARATQTHTEHTRAVQRATEKEQHLQAEIKYVFTAAAAAHSSQFSKTYYLPI